jgi:hypothetical protein
MPKSKTRKSFTKESVGLSAIILYIKATDKFKNINIYGKF